MKHLQSINELFGFGDKDALTDDIKRSLKERFPGKIRKFYKDSRWSDKNFREDTGIKRSNYSFEYDLTNKSRFSDRSDWGDYLWIGLNVKEFDDSDYMICSVSERVHEGDHSSRSIKDIKCDNVKDIIKLVSRYIRETLDDKERKEIEQKSSHIKGLPERRERERKFNTDSAKLLGSIEEGPEITNQKIVTSERPKVMSAPQPSRLSNLKKFLD